MTDSGGTGGFDVGPDPVHTPGLARARATEQRVDRRQNEIKEPRFGSCGLRALLFVLLLPVLVGWLLTLINGGI